MTAAIHRQPDPLPGDPLGQRLCEIFGRYLWCPIEATLPDDTTLKPEWTTITGYPLRPRVLWSLWKDAQTLIGVRFGQETTYALIDIDAGSQYCNPDAIASIRAALETIGVTRTLLLRSSWSGGLHLYIPLPEPVSTFNLAVALTECFKAQGLTLGAGQLETFPNIKAYGVATFTEYNGHRLPLQPGSGSCLLDEAFNPIGDSLDRFFWIWDGAASHQDLEALNQAMVVGRSNHRKRPKRRSQVTQAWRDDLEIEMAEGWTGHGQTNGLLKAIACYGVVFEQLQGAALEEYVLRIATTRPGYEQYCRHIGNIQHRVKAWARAAESYYWPLGSEPKRREDTVGPDGIPFNQQIAEAAQERIKSTVEQLKQLGQLPEAITARAKAIAQQGGIALRTLYKNLTLWHPQHQTVAEQEPERVEIPYTVEDTAFPMAAEAPESDLLESSDIKEFSTSPQYMKGALAPQGEVGSDPVYLSPKGGVRGGEPSFPQAPDPEHLGFLDDFAEGCRRQVQRLGWTAAQLGQFIADQFNGKRRWQLSDDELIALLYRLQAVEGG
jgi:hypothetical protein